MPYVNIRVASDGITTEQKAALIQGVTRLLADVLGKDPQKVMVVIDEIDPDNWGTGGVTVTQQRTGKQ